MTNPVADKARELIRDLDHAGGYSKTSLETDALMAAQCDPELLGRCFLKAMAFMRWAAEQ